MPIIGEVRAFAFDHKSPRFQRLIRNGWLPCDGRSLLIEDFEPLYKAIGSSWGSTNPELRFSLPNFFGSFLRGATLWNEIDGMEVKTQDPQAEDRKAPREELAIKGDTGLNVGSFQTNQNKQHEHKVTAKKAYGNAPHFPPLQCAGGAADATFETRVDDDGGPEARPVNHYILYMIYAGPINETLAKKLFDEISTAT